ncbi:TIGR01777 family oxidoreductase [Gimesia panareensis]|uniref:TIGR01777 family oxidoreductase n=1 Tax=Gimesia panareensis TaxID=2527978 RepID=UPI00118AC919|nr:TIGR01777 family oxidoreductase [Gimesia panareensis]QDU48319.1 Epimerase family protein [Gimesia panareensis]
MEISNKIIIAGGTGFLGLNLARSQTERDYEVVILGRNQPQTKGDWRYVNWDARSLGPWASELENATALVNLAGRTVDCIKTPDHCDEILRSRVEATDILGKAVRQLDSPPPVWVQMSTAHRYGDPPECICDEDSAFGYGLAPFVAQEWEAAFQRAVLPDMRQVILRTSFVIGRSGGALQRLAKLVRWGLGGTVGHGRQGMSWIHEQDMNRLFLRAITDDSMQGAYLATAPQPVSNAEFMRALRKALKMPIGLPAMSWMVRLGAPLLMRTDPELALYGRYCVSRRLREENFEFEYPDLDSALVDLYR